MREKPRYMDLLESRGVHARGSFVVEGDPPRVYSVTRSFRIVDLDGRPVGWCEDDVWERYERIHRIGRDAFEAARQARQDALWAAQGRPTREQLVPLADAFARAYAAPGGDWAFVCRYDEETIRRIIEAAAPRLPPRERESAREKEERIFRDVALAKAARR